MNQHSVRSVAAVMAVATTFGVLFGIGALAESQSAAAPLVAVAPRVEVTVAAPRVAPVDVADTQTADSQI